MEVTHKAACMVNHRHEKLLSYVKRKHGRTSRSPVCVTAAVEKVDSHLCLLHCGFGPFGFCRTLAYRYHLPSTETSGWNGWKVVDGHTARAFLLCLQADIWQHQRLCCHAVPIWVCCPTCVLILALLVFSRSFHVYSEPLFIIPN